MFNTVVGKRIALLGFAFKADTGDTRESPGIHVARKLLEERARLVITDPQALDNARRDLAGPAGTVEYEPDPYRAAAGRPCPRRHHRVGIYKTLDFERIFAAMSKPAFVFDGRNILDHRRLFEIGFNVYPAGQAELDPFQIGRGRRGRGSEEGICAGSSAIAAPRRPRPILLDGLKRLEYRGYDSAGLVVADGRKLNLVRAVGKVSDLEKKGGSPAAARALRHRPHALGHPRPPLRGKRPPPQRLRRQDRHRAQRHHRELPGR